MSIKPGQDQSWKTHSKKFHSLFPEVRQELKTTKKRTDTLFNHPPNNIFEDLKLILDNLTAFEAAYFESLRKQKKQSLQLSETFKSSSFSKYDFFKAFTIAHGLISYITFSDKKQIEGCLAKIEKLCFLRKEFITDNTPKHPLRSLIIEKLDSVIAKCKDEEILFSCGITISLEKDIQSLLNAFKANQYKARIVGGYVRDKLRLAKPHDVDIVVNCSQEEAESLLKRLGYNYFVSPHFPTLIQIKNRDLSYVIDITCTTQSLKKMQIHEI